MPVISYIAAAIMTRVECDEQVRRHRGLDGDRH